MIEAFQKISDLMKEDGFDPPPAGHPWPESGDILLKYILYLREKADRWEAEHDEVLKRLGIGGRNGS